MTGKARPDWENALQEWIDTEDHWAYVDRGGDRIIVARCPYCETVPVPAGYEGGVKLVCDCGRHTAGATYGEAVALWNDALRPLWKRRHAAVGAVRQAIADDPTVQLDFVLLAGLQALGVKPDDIPAFMFHYLTGGNDARKEARP